MTWNCPDCGDENDDDHAWCETCGGVRECGFCGEPVEEESRKLASGGEMDVLACAICGDTKHRFTDW